ncbi:hypothetical protein DM01DRAFT_307781 [Hesseltinella vesiculosa]|uniref:F-box domain-containing protein n=1 Tax=Hesseltinella vesiculosa TaxID=101127 RepID=A0A1X2GXN9_9FUNG|nr:hypothetical protein DM01DRAFT_307781 [Hesseltinella vesiculosa]
MTASDDSPAFILTLPWEIVYKIVDYIHLDDLLTLRLVCQHWDVMLSHGSLAGPDQLS